MGPIRGALFCFETVLKYRSETSFSPSFPL
nr:MAG TPA_asm: hypothetical protein [Caudoviricetes sp.]